MIRGRRIGSPVLVVHYAQMQAGHSRMGLAVGKNTGNSVVRHRVSRKLRHIYAASQEQWDAMGVDIVIRTLPPAASASSQQLTDLIAGLRQTIAERR